MASSVVFIVKHLDVLFGNQEPSGSRHKMPDMSGVSWGRGNYSLLHSCFYCRHATLLPASGRSVAWRVGCVADYDDVAWRSRLCSRPTETIVGSLLFYGVAIVLCLFNLSYCVTLMIAPVLNTKKPLTYPITNLWIFLSNCSVSRCILWKAFVILLE